MTDAKPMSMKYLRAPTRERPGYVFRMVTPKTLRGKPRPDMRGTFFGSEIVQGLGTRKKSKAGIERDKLVGRIRDWQERAERGEDLTRTDSEAEQDARALAETAERYGKDSDEYALHYGLIGDKIDRVRECDPRGDHYDPEQEERASRYAAAVLRVPTLSSAYSDYVNDRTAEGRTGFGNSAAQELRKAIERLTEFKGADVTVASVSKRDARQFFIDHLVTVRSPKAPRGLSRASIAKYKTLLTRMWAWCINKEIVKDGGNVWLGLDIPNYVGVDTSNEQRKPFSEDEWQSLADAAPLGGPLGDLMRLALMTGARRSEIVNIREADITKDPVGFNIHAGKTPNARRWVPLVGMAAEIVARRSQMAAPGGGLFPDVRAAKQGDALGKRFTTLRRRVLGAGTDERLAFHCFRHTFQTIARRAGVSPRDSGDVCGWTEGDNKGSGARYDHGLDAKRYVEVVERVAAEYERAGYLPVKGDPLNSLRPRKCPPP